MEKVVVLHVEDGLFPGDDAVGVRDDEALHRLPEHLVQLDDGQKVRVDEVVEDIAGADGRQLVRVPDHDEPATHGQRVHEGREQHDVHHGQFVHDDGIRLDGVAGMAGKAHLFVSGAFRLQQTVDSLRLFAGDLRHALRGAAGGCRQDDVEPVRLQQLQDGIDGGRLAGAGSAGEDEDALFDGGDDGFPLFAFIVDAGFPLHPLDVAVQRWPSRRRETDHHLDPLSAVIFRVEDVRQEHEFSAVEFRDPQEVFLTEVVDGDVDGIVVGPEQVRRRPQEFFPRQTGMTVVQVMVADVEDARPDAEPGVRFLVEGVREGIDPFEGHADVGEAQDVRVLHDHPGHIVPEYPVRVDGFRRRQTEGLERHHDLPDRILLLELLTDLLRFLWRYTADLREFLRMVPEDIEGFFPEGLDDLHRGRGTDALHRAAREVLQHLGHGARHPPLAQFRPELAAEGRVSIPVAGQAQFLARGDLRQDPDDGDEFAVLGRNVQHGKTGILSPEYQFLRHAF